MRTEQWCQICFEITLLVSDSEWQKPTAFAIQNQIRAVWNRIQVFKFQNISSTHHRNKKENLEGNGGASFDTPVNLAGLAVLEIHFEAAFKS